MPTRLKCLLVDDLDANLLALSALLRRDDVEILTARSGNEALELLLANDVALAFLDVQMPDMDGFELAELVRGTERTRQIPLIFVTAGAADAQRLFKGYETGAVDFLYKPIDPHMLKSKAEVFFQLARHKQQLAAQLAERTEALHMNELLTAALGHDLRNPLSAMMMSAQLLKRRSTDASLVRAAERIVSSGMRMGQMIEDLLDVVRARLGGGIVVNLASANLGAILETVVQEMRAAQPDVRINVFQDGNLQGTWDAGRLAQVFSNLLGNAVQHGAGGGGIDVRLNGEHADRVSFSVTNAGVIPPELLRDVFVPFRGGTKSSTRSEGLGLGLYIVQHIVRAHNGHVEVQSGTDNQTTFRVQLPRRGGTQGDATRDGPDQPRETLCR